MLTYEHAGEILDQAVDSLPEEIFRDLNGGVNLINRAERDEYGLLVMGTYNVNQMGRYVEIYYGSFCEKYPHVSAERFERELIKTLKHELTHHIESMALDRSLEKWDEQHVAELLSGLHQEEEPLNVSSILFVDANGAGLAEMAYTMFTSEALHKGLDDIHAECASYSPGALSIKAAKAAARYDISIASGGTPKTLTRELCEQFDAVMCMTDAQAVDLIARWPDLEEHIMCVGSVDFEEPRFDSQMSWNRLADNMASEISQLVAELNGEYDDD